VSIEKNRFSNGMRKLRRYESKVLVSSEYLRIHNREANASKVSSIVMSIKQGRELFESSARTDYMTRPIELYYGMSSFSRAMTLMADTSLSESALEQSHGLKLTNLPTAANSSKDVMDIKIEFINGSLTQWYEKAQKTFPLRARSSEPDWQYGYNQEDLAGESITLNELLNLIPDLWSELELVDGKRRVGLAVNAAQSTTISFNSKASKAEVAECFPGIKQSRLTGPNSTNWNIDYGDMVGFEPQLVQLNEDGFNIGSTLIVPPVGSLRLSPLSTYLISAYVMSMLARYRPSIWGAIWNGGAANEMYPLFSRLMDLGEGWFPYMFSQNMYNLNKVS
jgi:hypothetical protein